LRSLFDFVTRFSLLVAFLEGTVLLHNISAAKIVGLPHVLYTHLVGGRMLVRCWVGILCGLVGYGGHIMHGKRGIWRRAVCRI
jgi:hypothetical protein